MTDAATRQNVAVWQDLYARGKNDLRYPSDVLVRLCSRLIPAGKKLRILDFGFGTGANLIHLARLGHEMHGVEVSGHALETTRSRLVQAGLGAWLRLASAGERLPFEDCFFDLVIAWQVIYYNDRAGWRSTLQELERVCAPGGRLLIATAAPGDVSSLEAKPLGDAMFLSMVPGQEGCVMTIPDQADLRCLFAPHSIEVGEFGFEFPGFHSRHWVVTYQMEAT